MAKPKLVALEGSERFPVAGARAIALTPDREWMEVTLKLRRRRPLDPAAVYELGATPPRARRYPTRESFAKAHGADPRDLAEVKRVAASLGLQVTASDAARRSVHLAGTAAAMCQAFGVKLMRYQLPDGGEYRGRIGPVHLDHRLEGVVTAVFGLDDRRQARPRGRIRPLPPATSHASKARPWFTPLELGALYGFPGGDGQGQCVGILEFGGGFDDGDLDRYFQALKAPRPSVIAVGVDHAANRPGDADSDGEVMLDIEVVGALAPKARIAVYFSKFTEKGWVDAVAAAVHDAKNRPSVLSVSWGFAEGQLIWTKAAVQHVNDSLADAAMLGVTVCAASGDDGSSDDVEDGHAHVDFPASSPYVLGVGGTTLVAKGGKIAGETVWNGGPRATAGGASGGGVSDAIDLPPWQAGKVPPSVNPDRRVGRGVPDVAANADGQTGYYVRSDGQDGIAGGTSAAAPLWAALLARINQSLGKPVGYFNPLLYRTLGPARVCRDVKAGNNDTRGQIGGYAAKSGWDACTGWGSPDGLALLKALK